MLFGMLLALAVQDVPRYDLGNCPKIGSLEGLEPAFARMCQRARDTGDDPDLAALIAGGRLWQGCAVVIGDELKRIGKASSTSVAAEASADACKDERTVVRGLALNYVRQLVAGDHLAQDKADAIVFEYRAVVVRKVRERLSSSQ